MFCPYCGEKMDAARVFCPRCGERIPSGSSEKTSSEIGLAGGIPFVMQPRYAAEMEVDEEEDLVPLDVSARRARKSAILPVVLTICAVVSAACIILLVGNALQKNGLIRPLLESSAESAPSSGVSGAGGAESSGEMTSSESSGTASGIRAKVYTSRPALLDSLKSLAISGAEASSSYGTPGDIFYHGPELAIDGDPLTSWQEGVDGGGKGESITVHLTKKRKVQALVLKLGNWRDESSYFANHRPRRLTLKIGSQSFLLNFKDQMTEQYVVLSEPVKADSFTLVMVKRYAGTTTTDNCISEIEAWG